MSPAPRPRGFTLIEVLLVVVLTVFGFLGLLTLQVATVHGSSDAKDLSQATNLAGHFIETVKLEAMQWQNDTTLSAAQGHFRYLPNADGAWHAAFLDVGQSSGMVRRNGNADFGTTSVPLPVTALDAGLMQEMGAGPPEFCVFYRLTPIIANTALRLETRVLFRKVEGRWNLNYRQCLPGNLTTMMRDSGDVASVAMLTSVAINLVGP